MPPSYTAKHLRIYSPIDEPDNCSVTYHEVVSDSDKNFAASDDRLAL